MPIMSIKTKIALLAIVIITALATIFAANYHPKSYENIIRPIIKIDAYLPLSGNGSKLGLAAQQTIQNLLNKTNAQTAYKYDINYIDSKQATSNALPQNIFISLENNPDSQVVLNFPDNNKIRIKTDYQDIISRLVPELKKRGIKKAAFISLASGEYRTFANMLNQALKPEIDMVGAVYQREQDNFIPIINMLINNDADFYILLGPATETDKLIKLLNQKGIANYKIATIFAGNTTGKLDLYNQTLLISPDAGRFNNKMFAMAILSLIEAYEKNYKPETIASTQQVYDYLSTKKSVDNEIVIKTGLYEIKDKQIIPIKE